MKRSSMEKRIRKVALGPSVVLSMGRSRRFRDKKKEALGRYCRLNKGRQRLCCD